MSMLGKILAGLNILGAAAFVYVAALDYGKRQAWAYAVYRHDLFIHGIPVDDEQLNHEGNKLTTYLNDETKRELFGGRPVTTQTQEVSDLYKRLQGKIAAVQEVRRQLAVYARVLLPLARTNRDRERMISYLTYLTDDKGVGLARVKKLLGDAYQEATRRAALPDKPDQPKKTFNQAFWEALEAMGRVPGDPFGSVPTDPFGKALLATRAADPKKPFDKVFDESLEAQRKQLEEKLALEFQPALARAPDARAREVRRQAIAHLLLTLINVLPEDTSAGAKPPATPLEDPEYKRALNVVGLESAITETNDQAQVVARIASEVALERQRDRSRFVVAHGSLLDHVRERAGQVAWEEALLARKTAQRAEQENLFTRRKGDYDAYMAELKASQKLTADRLRELRKMSDSLFDIRKTVRDALDKNQQLEKQIRGLEAGR